MDRPLLVAQIHSINRITITIKIELILFIIYRGYLLFSVKDRNLFHEVDTIDIFTSGAATSENITDDVTK